MATTTSSGLLVWRRDLTPESRTWVWWAIGVIMALAAFGAFAAYMAENGEIATFLGLGVFGSVLTWLIPRVYHWAKIRNPEIRMEGRELCWAKARVPIDQVERWSARSQTTTMYNGTTTSRVRVGVLNLNMFDGSETVFTFPLLKDAEIATLATAIEPILPGRRDTD